MPLESHEFASFMSLETHEFASFMSLESHEFSRSQLITRILDSQVPWRLELIDLCTWATIHERNEDRVERIVSYC